MGKGSVIGKGVLGGEPVVGEQFGVNLAEGRKKVDGMVGLAKLIAGDGQGESEAEQDGQAGRMRRALSPSERELSGEDGAGILGGRGAA